MNLSLERIGLLVSIVVNILLASSVLYQNRGVIRANDPRFPGVISKLESQLKQVEGRVETGIKKYEREADSRLKAAFDKAQQASDATKAQIEEIEKKAKEYYNKTDKLESAGAKADKAMHYVEDQLKRLVK